MRLNAAWRGADNREILRELGRSEEEIDALLAAEVIGEPDPTGGLRG